MPVTFNFAVLNSIAQKAVETVLAMYLSGTRHPTPNPHNIDYAVGFHNQRARSDIANFCTTLAQLFTTGAGLPDFNAPDVAFDNAQLKPYVAGIFPVGPLANFNLRQDIKEVLVPVIIKFIKALDELVSINMVPSLVVFTTEHIEVDETVALIVNAILEAVRKHFGHLAMSYRDGIAALALGDHSVKRVNAHTVHIAAQDVDPINQAAVDEVARRLDFQVLV